jgi:hypothetical protein
MPKTDYSDPEIQFPRLEVRAQTIDDESFWLQAWVWDRAGDGRGGERHQVMNSKQAGGLADIKHLAYGIAAEQGVQCGPDDITIDDV